MFATSAVGSLTSESHYWDYLAKSGIGLAVFVILFAIYKLKLVELVSVEQETVAVRESWGRPKYYHRWVAKVLFGLMQRSDLACQMVGFATHSAFISRFVGKTGRLVVLHAGPHKVLRGWQNLIVVNLREIVLEIDAPDMTFLGRTLEYKPRATMQVAYEDSREGDKNLVKSIYSVRDPDTKDKDIGVLRDKFRAMFFQSFSDIQPEVEPDEQGFPQFNLESVQEKIGPDLISLHGYTLKKLFVPPMAWTPAQVEKDGRVEAAKIEAEAKVTSANILAMALKEASSTQSQTIVSAEMLSDTA